MADILNLRNINNISRASVGRQYLPGKKNAGTTDASRAGASDVVQISAEAAIKGRLSAFAAALAKETGYVGAARIADLKERYAGDNCPVCGADIAAAMLARGSAEGDE